MTIRTSANLYRRGIPNSYNNFAHIAQTNNTAVVPMYKYMKGYNFYNRMPVSTRLLTYRGALYPWNN